MNNWTPLNDWTWHLGWMELLVISVFAVVVILTIIMLRLRSRNDQKAQDWKRMEAAWSAYLPAVMAREKPHEELWNQVRPNETLFFVDYLYRIACTISERSKDNPRYGQLMALAAPYLKPIAKRVENQKSDPELRARSVATLGKLAPFQYLGLIENALDDPSDRVAFAAMRALVDHDDPHSSDMITRVFSRFHGFNPEFVAALLARCNPTLATPRLMEHLVNNDSPLWGRVVAICTLEHWPAFKEYVPQLLAMGKDRNQPATIRALILRVLSAWRAEAEARELIYEFASGDEEILRAHAMYAIGRLKLESEHELLELGLYDTARWVAIEAATAWERVEGDGVKESRPRWYLQSLDPVL